MVSIVVRSLGDGVADTEDVEQNVALGRFMTAWSEVEKAVSFLFRSLAKMDPELGSLIFDHVRVNEQLEITRALIEAFMPADEKGQALEIMAEVKSLSVRRNKIAHAGWGLLNNMKARFHESITLVEFNEIISETQRGNTIRASRIHTIGDLNHQTDLCLSVYGKLLPFIQRSTARKIDHELEPLRALYEKRGLELPRGLARQAAPQTPRKDSE